MLRSMTGYGRSEAGRDGYRFLTEIKTVNHRYLEVSIRLPRPWSGVEDRVRQEIAGRLSRGRVEVVITSLQGPETTAIKFNPEMVQSYLRAFEQLRELVGEGAPPGLETFLTLPGVLETGELLPDLEKGWEVLKDSIIQAVDELIRARELEGKRLADDLLHRLAAIEQFIKDIEARSPRVVEEYRQKLQTRIQELLDGVSVDETRLAMEVALMADRSSITEELVRLSSHIRQCRDLIEGPESTVGRRMDFMLQEMNREINTIGSKTSDLTIAQVVIEVKAELEKIREQVQNLE